MSMGVYVDCVNCGKQNLIEDTEPYDVKCEYGNHSVRIKIQEAKKMNVNTGSPGQTEDIKVKEGAGVPLTAAGLGPASAPLYEDKPTLTETPRTASGAPAAPSVVPPRPSNLKYRDKYFDKNKAAILQDYKIMRYKEFLRHWHLSYAKLVEIFLRWEEPFKRGNKKNENKLPKGIINEPAADEERKRHLEDTKPVLPPFPMFNDTWCTEVKLEWLRSRVKMEELISLRAKPEFEEYVRRHAGVHESICDTLLSIIEIVKNLDKLQPGLFSRIFKKRGGEHGHTARP